MFHALLKLAVYNAYSLGQFSKGKKIKPRRGKASYLRDYSHYVSARARDGIEDVLAVLNHLATPITQNEILLHVLKGVNININYQS